MSEYLLLDKEKRIYKNQIKNIIPKIDLEDRKALTLALDLCEAASQVSFVDFNVFDTEEEEEISMNIVEPFGFTVILTEEEEGGFSIECPELPGCVSQGETEEEAIENIKEAITAYTRCINSNQIDISELKPKTKIERI